MEQILVMNKTEVFSTPFEDWHHRMHYLFVRLPRDRQDFAGPSDLPLIRSKAFRITLEIEVQEKLEWNWSQVDWRQFAFSFVSQPGFQQIWGEYLALEQPVVIRLQCVKHLT